MAQWAPPHTPGSRRDDHLGCLLVLSTPDGLTSRWEDQEPPAPVRSEVAAFARRMSDVDLAQARRIDPPPHLQEQLIEQDFRAELADDERGDANLRRGVDRQAEYGRVVYLRLRARSCPDGQTASSEEEIVVDFDFGPMGAPPEYPRVSDNDLLRYAAENA
jgi:hypothetical protein